MSVFWGWIECGECGWMCGVCCGRRMNETTARRGGAGKGGVSRVVRGDVDDVGCVF